MNITITGDLGSGKTTVSELLAERLGMELIDTGKIYRQFANDKGLDVLGQNNSSDWSIDRKIDSEVERLGKEFDNQIFVSRLAWYFIPNALKIYLIQNPLVAAERIMEDESRISESHSSVKETLEFNMNRSNAELKRYYEMYGIEDARGYNEADIVIVVGKNFPVDVFNCIKAAIENNQYGFYIDPKVLIPTHSISASDVSIIKKCRERFKPALIQTVDIEVCESDHSYFLIDGLYRVIACIKNEVKFIKCERPHCMLQEINKSYVHDYEDLTGISLKHEFDYREVRDLKDDDSFLGGTSEICCGNK